MKASILQLTVLMASFGAGSALRGQGFVTTVMDMTVGATTMSIVPAFAPGPTAVVKGIVVSKWELTAVNGASVSEQAEIAPAR